MGVCFWLIIKLVFLVLSVLVSHAPLPLLIFVCEVCVAIVFSILILLFALILDHKLILLLLPSFCRSFVWLVYSVFFVCVFVQLALVNVDYRLFRKHLSIREMNC